MKINSWGFPMKNILLTMMAAGLITTGFSTTNLKEKTTYIKLDSLNIETPGPEVYLRDLNVLQTTFVIENVGFSDANGAFNTDIHLPIMQYCITDDSAATDSSIQLSLATKHLTDNNEFAMKSGDRVKKVNLYVTRDNHDTPNNVDLEVMEVSETNPKVEFLPSGTDCAGLPQDVNLIKAHILPTDFNSPHLDIVYELTLILQDTVAQ